MEIDTPPDRQPEHPPPTAALLAEVAALYERGLYLQAYERTRPHGPLARWSDRAAATWAGRLASNLGSRRLARVIHWRNYKRHRHQRDTCAYHLQGLFDHFGPLSAARFVRNLPPRGADSPPEAEVYLLTLQAGIATAFRDFVSAEQWLQQAEAVRTDHAWIAVCRASLLERQDRYEEALEHARASLAVRADYRPGVQQTAHLLQVLQRHDEALALLREASARLESCAVTCQLAVLEQELELFPEALASLERCLALSPLADDGQREWADRNRVAIHCRMRQYAAALPVARRLTEPFYKELADRLAGPKQQDRRVLLKVPFVRQHDMTCAPATLSALSRFWGQPAEHLELAEAICYDGTPGHSERHWAVTHGWVAREFTVTWEAAVALLDRGIPFTLATTEITSAHLQAVIGYDELRRSLFLRDPFFYTTSEALCPQFLERQAATGPRGMAMVPVAQAGLLAGIALPDAETYDEYHALNRALFLHQRDAAMAALARLQEMAPEHRLTLAGRWTVAAYDANTLALLDCTDRSLQVFPGDGRLLNTRLSCLGELAKRQERLEFLAELAHRPAVDPLFWVHYASELRLDGRALGAALSWIRWALRYRPTDPQFLAVYGDVLWDRREFEAAMEAYRLASCLNPRHERYARSYFIAARFLKRTGEAIAYLRNRFDELGGKAAWPAITLINACLQEDDVHAATTALEAAQRRRPDDADLLLFAGDTWARLGDRDRAEQLLAQAEGRTQRAAWLRSAANLANYRCERQRSLELWREVLALDPLALDANRAVAGLLAETESREAARTFLEQVCARFPAHCGLLAIRVEFARHDGTAAHESALRQLLEVNPADAWAHRELALMIHQPARRDEAIALASTAIALEPGSPFGHSVRGELHLAAGNREAARHDLETALRLSVDCGAAMQLLLRLGTTPEERLATLEFIQSELVRQVVFGDALFAFRDAALGVLEPDRVLARLQEARGARPDLWEAWSQEAAQLRDMSRLDEALRLMEQANERFPLLPRLWVERAELHRVRLETDAAIAALEKALQINPGFTEASQRLGELLVQAGRFDPARETLERACIHAPLNAFAHGCLADVLWRLGQRDAALQKLQHALRLEPGYTWAWRTVESWAGELQRPGLAVQLAQDLATRRPGEPRSHQMLAHALADANDEAAIPAAERAITLNPEVVESHDLKARVLVRFNRFDEALAACRPAGLRPQPPQLQMREAWVESTRGDITRAIALMKAALEQQPANIWGWQRLADWSEEIGDLDVADQAAERLVQLSPHDPVPLGYAASLSRRKGERAAAIGRFRRAFRLDPDYRFAGLSLFDLLLEERDLDGAEEILNTLARHREDEYVEARRGILAVSRHQWPEALAAFTRLCRAKTNDAWCLRALADALVQAGRATAVDRTVKQVLAVPAANDWLGTLWVDRRFARNRYRPDRRFRRLVAEGAAGGRHALARFLDRSAQTYLHHQKSGEFVSMAQLKFHGNAVLRRHRDLVQSDDAVWGHATYFLASTGQFRRLVDFPVDWRSRKGLEGWMLHNLVVGHQLTGRLAEARDMIRRGLGLRLDRELFEAFTVKAAFEAAQGGEVAEAEALTTRVDPGRLDAIDKPLYYLTSAMIEARLAGAADPEALCARVVHFLKQAAAGHHFYFQHALLRKAYWRAIETITQRPELARLKGWGRWHYLGPYWSFVAGAVAGVVLTPYTPATLFITLICLFFLKR